PAAVEQHHDGFAFLPAHLPAHELRGCARLAARLNRPPGDADVNLVIYGRLFCRRFCRRSTLTGMARLVPPSPRRTESFANRNNRGEYPGRIDCDSFPRRAAPLPAGPSHSRLAAV